MRRRAFLGALLGAAAGPPLTASAQPTEKGARRIAIVHLGGTEATVSEGGAPRWRAFFAELRQRGYAVDKNLVVERVAIERAIWQSIIDLGRRSRLLRMGWTHKQCDVEDPNRGVGHEPPRGGSDPESSHSRRQYNRDRNGHWTSTARQAARVSS